MDNATVESLVTSLSEPTSRADDATAQSLLVLKIACFCAISLVGTTANVAICKKLIRRKQKSSEYFIINLAVADLTVCAMGIPLDIYDQLHKTWQYGAFLCKIIWPYQTLLMLVSIMTLTAMSLERHRAIMTPFKPRLKKSDLLKAIACVWIIGLCVIAPYVNFLTYDGGECMETWPTQMGGAYYTLALFVIDYCIPLSIITFCYARAGHKLYKNTKQFSGEDASISNVAQRKRLRRNTRIIKIFSFAVVMFLVCMLPGDCYWMWRYFGNNPTFEYDDHIKTFATIFVYANSAINPFIFGACRFGCFQMFRAKHHRKLKTVLSFQSQESQNQTTIPRCAKKERCKDEVEEITVNGDICDFEKLRETNV